MNSSSHELTKPAPHGGRIPWLLFLFIAAVFFLAVHDPYFSKNADFNPSQADLIALADSGSLIRRIAMLFLGLFGVGSLIRNRRTRHGINGFLGWTVLVYATWVVLSLTWAEDPALTVRRLVVFAILCLGAVAVARRCSIREIALLTFFWSLLFLLIGMCAEILLGTFHPLTSGYRFEGTQHPNSQGINCALLLLSGIAAGDIEGRKRVLFRACALLGLVFLILTGSRTAFVAAVAGLSVYWAMASSKAIKIFVPLGLSAALYVLLIASGGALLPNLRNAIMLGRGASDIDSFNGRSGIWEEVGHYIDQHPIVGYGYGGFWTEGHITAIPGAFGSAHSAYLECLLDVGLAGLVPFLLALFGGIARSFVLYKRTHAAAFAFCGAFLILCATDGFLESIIVDLALPAFLIMTTLARLAFACEPKRAGAATSVYETAQAPSEVLGLLDPKLQ